MSRTFNAQHIVVGTYRRQPTINVEHERELYMFIYKFLTDRGIHVYRIGGMPEHVHIICNVPPTFKVSDVVKWFKAESSKVTRHNPHFPLWHGWARGYNSESISRSIVDTCVKYIRNQKAHHQTQTFEDECRDFLRRNDLPLDEILGDDDGDAD